jgi:hypothetical protein
MMPQLEPTYLRYIYDGLIKGSIHPENAAELPEGLIGLYEEAFDERTSVLERQKLLHRFAIWALLKKEVSEDFVAEVLQQPVEEIHDFISTYSAWFNSPESGKYQLYHERLKVYLLQKSTKKEIEILNQSIISLLNKSLQNEQNDEIEMYALQFLSDHLLVSATISNVEANVGVVKLALNKDFLDRQLYLSMGYSWSKSCIRNAISFLTYKNEFQLNNEGNLLVELGLILVDQFYQEQNDGPNIVRLISMGNPEIAFQRIDAFGGESEQDQQRQFVLFVLCLIEMLYTAETKVNSEDVKQLCAKLNNQVTIEWHNEQLIPHALIFEIACKLEQMGIDQSNLTCKIRKWDFNWISTYPQFNSNSFSVLMGILTNEKDPINKNSGLSMFSIRLCELDKFKESFLVQEMISEDMEDVELPF